MKLTGALILGAAALVAGQKDVTGGKDDKPSKPSKPQKLYRFRCKNGLGNEIEREEGLSKKEYITIVKDVMRNDGNCAKCKPGYMVDGEGNCAEDADAVVCPTQACAKGARRNRESCECECRPGFTVQGDEDNQVCRKEKMVCDTGCDGGKQHPFTCECYCPRRAKAVNGVCPAVCNPKEVACEGGKVNKDCQCSCRQGSDLVEGVCTKPQKPEKCDRKAAFAMCKNGKVQKDDCSCICRKDWSYDAEAGVCNAPEKCDTSAVRCGGGKIHPHTCACYCPRGATLEDGVCTSPLNTCDHKLAMETCIDGKVDKKDCSCNCRKGWTHNADTGTCDKPVQEQCDKKAALKTCRYGKVSKDCSCTCRPEWTHNADTGVCERPVKDDENEDEEEQNTCDRKEAMKTCLGGSVSSECECRCRKGETLVDGKCGSGEDNDDDSCTRSELVAATKNCVGGMVDKQTCACNCRQGDTHNVDLGKCEGADDIITV